MLIKKFIYIILTLIVLISIYYLSSMNNKETNSLSKGIVYKSIELVEGINHKEYDKKSIVNKLNYPIRKCAHFTLFLLLGVCIFLLLNSFNISNRFIISIVLCIIFSILDETHQIFTSGRTPLLTDIIIDSFGSVVGILFINRISNRNKECKKE